MSENLYDFNDLSDLPEDLSHRLGKSAVASPNVKIYADIIAAASKAGLKIMSISQVEAVAHRMGLDTKAQQTIRTALNSGVKAGLLFKPTRQTYAVKEVGESVESTDTPVDVLDTPSALNNEAPVISPVAASSDAQIDPLA